MPTVLINLKVQGRRNRETEPPANLTSDISQNLNSSGGKIRQQPGSGRNCRNWPEGPGRCMRLLQGHSIRALRPLRYFPQFGIKTALLGAWRWTPPSAVRSSLPLAQFFSRCCSVPMPTRAPMRRAMPAKIGQLCPAAIGMEPSKAIPSRGENQTSLYKQIRRPPQIRESHRQSRMEQPTANDKECPRAVEDFLSKRKRPRKKTNVGPLCVDGEGNSGGLLTILPCVFFHGHCQKKAERGPFKRETGR